MNTPALLLLLDNRPAGPYSQASVLTMWQAGTLTGATLCRPEGARDWMPLASVVAPAPGLAPPPARRPWAIPLQILLAVSCLCGGAWLRWQGSGPPALSGALFWGGLAWFLILRGVLFFR